MAATIIAAGLLVISVTPGAANATGPSPLLPFLLKKGDMSGFVPGKARVFRTVQDLREASGERPSGREIKRYEAEGFVEGATVKIHGRTEVGAEGASSILEFEAAEGAKVELRTELKEEFNRKILGKEGGKFFTLRRFKVPGVPEAVAFEFVTNKLADALGIETGVAKGMAVEGSCLLETGILRLQSKEVTKPIISGVQAMVRRTGGICP
jgi:hypothetical protein